MNAQTKWLVLLFTLGACGPGLAGQGEHVESVKVRAALQRWHPEGGWDPYGGGLLHWWNPHCFPHGGSPDDYCRKPLPKVCWPAYPPYFMSGAPQPVAPPIPEQGPPHFILPPAAR